MFFWTPKSLFHSWSSVLISMLDHSFSLSNNRDRQFEFKCTFIVWAYLPASLIKYVIDDSRKEGTLY